MNNITLELKKNPQEIIRITPREYQGKNYVDIRLWFSPAGEDFKPTRKGFILSLEQFEELREAIR